VRPLFDSHPNFVVCGEAEHGSDAVEKAPNLRPDLIVIDMSMPVMNGLEAAPLLIKLFAQRLAHTADDTGISPAVPASAFGWDTRRGSEKQDRNSLDRTGRSSFRHDTS
jgi:DNA-binding NarL/FixJ family response regulator